MDKGEPDAKREEDDNSIRRVYHRYKWERAPTVSVMVAVDEKVNISGRDWVAERLRDS